MPKTTLRELDKARAEFLHINIADEDTYRTIVVKTTLL
jgi:hypothetical protein